MTNRLSFKERQLDKERCIKNFKQCDTISAEIIVVRKERASVESQLSALLKKDAKSEWYKKKATKKINKSKGPASDTQRKIPFLLSKSSTSSSTDDSHDPLTYSDSSMENVRDSPPPCDEIPVISIEEKQDFPQVPPEITNLIEKYIEQTKRPLSQFQTLSSDTHSSIFEELSLHEYINACMLVCNKKHNQPCDVCFRMIKVAQTVLDKGFLKLKTAFTMVSPDVTCTACTKKVAPNPACKSWDWGSEKRKLFHIFSGEAVYSPV